MVEPRPETHLVICGCIGRWIIFRRQIPRTFGYPCLWTELNGQNRLRNCFIQLFNQHIMGCTQTADCLAYLPYTTQGLINSIKSISTVLNKSGGQKILPARQKLFVDHGIRYIYHW